MNGTLDRIRDDNEALKTLKETRKKLAEIGGEIYGCEPRTMAYRAAFSCISIMVENLITAVESAIRIMEMERKE